MVSRRSHHASHEFLRGIENTTVHDLVIKPSKGDHFICSFRVEDYGVLRNVSLNAQDEIGAFKAFNKFMKKRGMKFSEQEST